MRKNMKLIVSMHGVLERNIHENFDVSFSKKFAIFDKRTIFVIWQ